MLLGPSGAEGSWTLEHRVWDWTTPQLGVTEQLEKKSNKFNAGDC